MPWYDLNALITGTQKARTDFYLARNLVTLKEATPGWDSGNGIFKYLIGFLWNPMVGVAQMLDTDYYGNYSGDKIASKLVHSLVDDETGELSNDSLVTLSGLILRRYSVKWNILWEQYAVQPWFDNVAITETTSGTENAGETKNTSAVEGTSDTGQTVTQVTAKSNDNTTTTRSGNVERKEGGVTSQSETETGVSVSETAHSGTVVEAENSSGVDRTFGFDSGDTGVKKDSSIAENSNTQTFNNKDTITETPNRNSSAIVSHGRTTTENYNHLSDILSGSGNRDESSKKTTSDSRLRTNKVDANRNSNVVTTGTRLIKGFDYRRQDRIQYLIQLFENPNLLPFFENVYDDVDQILCIPVYK